MRCIIKKFSLTNSSQLTQLLTVLRNFYGPLKNNSNISFKFDMITNVVFIYFSIQAIKKNRFIFIKKKSESN